jgi:hypothetical protein
MNTKIKAKNERKIQYVSTRHFMKPNMYRKEFKIRSRDIRRISVLSISLRDSETLWSCKQNLRLIDNISYWRSHVLLHTIQ